MTKTKNVDQEISELEKQIELLKEKKEKLENPDLLNQYIQRKVKAEATARTLAQELRIAMNNLDKFYRESKEMVPVAKFHGPTYGSGDTRFAYSDRKFKSEAGVLGISPEELEELLDENAIEVSRNYNREVDTWISSSTDC